MRMVPPGGLRAMVHLLSELGVQSILKVRKRRQEAGHFRDFDRFLPPGTPAPDFTLRNLKGNEISLRTYQGRYVVLEFGAYTWPPFRRQVAPMEDLARQYVHRPVHFLLVYTREPHAGEGIYRSVEQPTEYGQRAAYAHRTCTELSMQREILVDTMDSAVQRNYGGLPNMIYIIGPDGRVVFHDRWADAQGVSRALNSLLPAQ